MENYVSYIKNLIFEYLPGKIGCTGNVESFIDDLPDSIIIDTMENPMERTVAIEYINNWWDASGDFFDAHLGDGLPTNPFMCPDEWVACMVVDGINIVLGKAFYEVLTPEQHASAFELTDELCTKVLACVEKMDEIVF